MKTNTFVFGFNLLIVNLTGMLLAKKDSEVDTTFDPTPLVFNPFPISLFSGLIFEDEPIEAVVTLESAMLLLTLENDPMLKNALLTPNQLTLYELCKLVNASLRSSFARKIEYRFVLLSVTSGATVSSYHESTFGEMNESPTY